MTPYACFKAKVFYDRCDGDGHAYCEAKLSCCQYVAIELHHIVSRKAWKAGLLVASNVLCVCVACHDWIEKHFTEALKLGLSKRRERE